jgi:hypothetical protein
VIADSWRTLAFISRQTGPSTDHTAAENPAPAPEMSRGRIAFGRNGERN